MKLTFIGLNSWLIDIADRRVLIDPWLVDDLVLYAPWLFTAKHRQAPIYSPQTLPSIDLMLISQALDDHCHVPTLSQLSRQIPTIASVSASQKLKKLGFDRVTALAPWQTHTVAGIEVMATPGAKIQTTQENGFTIAAAGTNIYYEPHLATDANTINRLKSIDFEAIIAPAIGQIFPGLGKVIMNPQDALNLVSALTPRYFLPTALGEIDTTGLLPKLTRMDGTLTDFQNLLATANLPTQLLALAMGESYLFPRVRTQTHPIRDN
jgi:L-ascorbate metabolism protein UlaG (beta-lactamase superfamily)